MFRRSTLLVTCIACSAPPVVEPPRTDNAKPAAPSPDAAVTEAKVIDAAVIDAPAIALADADCRALASARALAIVTVASATADCSGVGHVRIVFDVRRLARGEQITRVVTSRPLYGASRERIAAGDLFLAAIDPEARPAATVFCVAIPAHQGTVRHLVRADSRDHADRLLEAARACR